MLNSANTHGNRSINKFHVVFLQMAVNGGRQKGWTRLSLSTSFRAWLLALIIISDSPTATAPSGRLTSRQKGQVLHVFCLHSSSVLSSSLLPPLGFPHLNIKAWSHRVSCSSLLCMWSAFKDFCEKRAWLATWNDPLLLFVYSILLCCWNATLSEFIMICLFCCRSNSLIYLIYLSFSFFLYIHSFFTSSHPKVWPRCSQVSQHRVGSSVSSVPLCCCCWFSSFSASSRGVKGESIQASVYSIMSMSIEMQDCQWAQILTVGMCIYYVCFSFKECVWSVQRGTATVKASTILCGPHWPVWLQQLSDNKHDTCAEKAVPGLHDSKQDYSDSKGRPGLHHVKMLYIYHSVIFIVAPQLNNWSF